MTMLKSVMAQHSVVQLKPHSPSIIRSWEDVLCLKHIFCSLLSWPLSSSIIAENCFASNAQSREKLRSTRLNFRAPIILEKKKLSNRYEKWQADYRLTSYSIAYPKSFQEDKNNGSR